MRRTHARAHRASATGSDSPPSRFGDPAAARAAAKQGGERFRLLFDHASVGIIAVGADGRAVEANPAVERMLGYDPGELTNVSFTEFTHPDDVDISKDLYHELLQDERASYQYEKRYLRRTERSSGAG